MSMRLNRVNFYSETKSNCSDILLKVILEEYSISTNFTKLYSSHYIMSMRKCIVCLRKYKMVKEPIRMRNLKWNTFCSY